MMEAFRLLSCVVQLRRVATFSRRAQSTEVENQFDAWVSANALPGSSKPSVDSSNESELEISGVSTAAVVNEKQVQRLHHSMTGSFLRELLQHNQVCWSSEQRLFLCKGIEMAALGDQSKGIKKKLISCRPSIARGSTNAAVKAAAQSCSTLKLPPLQMPAADLTSREADDIILQLAQMRPTNDSCLIVLLSADSAALGLWTVRHKQLVHQSQIVAYVFVTYCDQILVTDSIVRMELIA